MARSKAKSSIISVDFEGVEAKGKRLKAGEYVGEVKEVSREGGKKDDYLAWQFEVDGGGIAYFNTSLSKKALWNLRGLLEAMGEEVPDGDMDIDLEDMVGKRVGIVIEMGEYNGKPRSEMVDYFSEDDFEGGSTDKEDKDEDDDKLKKSDVEDLDRDDLLKLNKKHKLKVDADEFDDNKKGNKKLLAAVLEALEEKELLEDEEKLGKKGKKKGDDDGEEKLSREKVEDMDEDELKDVVKENKLKVDLSEYKTATKMAKAVIAALEKKDLLED